MTETTARPSGPSPETRPPGSGDAGGAGPPGPGGAREALPLLRRWLADLAMGARFALGGGREGWTRTTLTAVGVGLGVAVLLLASSVPHLISAREAREGARESSAFYTGNQHAAKTSDRSLLMTNTDTEYHGSNIRGRLVQPEGTRPVTPPGLAELPGPGEMAVSPALKRLLDSSAGELLRDRLPGTITATIADEGLLDPYELVYYGGSADLAGRDSVDRVDGFGDTEEDQPLAPELLLLLTVICVVLLLPVAAFVAAAVRFGGERRDRRLAALRLVGADTRMTRRIATGEAAMGAVLGLLVGAAVFLLLRQLLGGVRMWDTGVFPADVRPSPGLVALIAVGVPGCAVAVSLMALRAVVIEPLGVVRRSGLRQRRIWWRLVPLVVGTALLFPLLEGVEDGLSTFQTYQIAAGITLILLGVNLLLPWLLESAARRLRGGRLPFQLAVRRLQLDSGPAARAVSGITVAVAGAVALQMLFSGVADEETALTGQSRERAQLLVTTAVEKDTRTEPLAEDLAATRGVTGVLAMTSGYGMPTEGNPDEIANEIKVADCRTLKELARIGSCENGDVFLVRPGSEPEENTSSGPQAESEPVTEPLPEPGTEMNIAMPDYDRPEGQQEREPVLWRVPEDARTAGHRVDPMGAPSEGILATPGAFDVSRMPDATADVFVRTDPGVADAEEYVRNTAAAASPTAWAMSLKYTDTSSQFAAIERGLYIGAVAILLLIGASMVVSTLEQLRERKRLMSVLIAFGTRRSTLAWSVLWQTALPVVIGLALAALAGVGLGVLLLRMGELPLIVDWAGLAAMTGLGGGLILLVAAVSMPVLWRLMRPDGLRTE